MTEAEIKAWQDQHGGIGENSPSPADTKGLVTHRAADGAWVVVDAKGQLVSGGSRPGVVDQQGATPAAAPSSPSPRGGRSVALDPNELNSPEQWINDPTALQALTPPNGIDVTSGNYYANVKQYRDGRKVVEWYQRGTGTNGKDDILATVPSVVPTIRDKWEADQRAEQTQAARGDQEGDTRGPQNGQTREEYHNGKWGVVANPLYTGTAPAAANQKPAGSTTQIEGTPLPGGGFDNERPVMVTRKPDGSVFSSEPLTTAEMTEWRGNRERSRNPGGKTDAEIQTATTAAQTATTAAAASRRADSAEARAIAEANKVGSKVEDLVIQGQHYTKITKTSPDGKTTAIEHYGPDGNQIARLPTEGEASVGGPAMPQIIAGHIEDSIREYHTKLWNDPSLTPEQREKRFQEFVQVATATQNQANEQQRERESQRNADYNTANSKLTYLENSTQAALTFTQGLIGKAKPGSGAVGEIFAALMGISALKMQLSGINDLKSTVTSSQLALNNPAKLAEQTQQIASQVAAAAAPTTSAPETAVRAAVQAAAPAAIEPSRSVPLPGATVAPASAAPTSTTLPAGRPDQTQASPQIESAINPPQGAATPQPTNVAPYQDSQTEPAQQATPAVSHGAGGDTQGSGTVPDTELPTSPYNANPDQGPVGQSQQSEWAALAALQQQQQAEATAQQQQTNYSDSPALLHAEAASRAPWQMSDADYQRYKAAGIPDDVIFKIPGRAAA